MSCAVAEVWWNHLTAAERLEVARKAGLLHRATNAKRLSTCGWDELLPLSQRKELQRYHFEVIAVSTA
jgi:hypothetical protein